MALLLAKKKKKSLIEMVIFYFDENERWKEAIDSYEVLVDIVATIRPKKLKNLQPVDIVDLISLLHENHVIRKSFSVYIKGLFLEKESIK